MVKKGYKQTEIGVIPEDWNISTLEMQYNITSSKRVFQSEWRDSGVPFYRAREIAVMGEGVPAPKDLYISEKMYEQYSKQYGAIKENDVLITGVGTLGKVYVVKKDDRFYFKDGNIIWLQWNGRYSSQFLKQLYRTPVLTDQVFGNAGGSTVPTYTITNAKATVVPCPAYQEQCDIAEVLFDTDELIATIEKQISKKKAIKQGAMQELLTGKRRLPGFEGAWKTKNLREYCTLVTKQTGFDYSAYIKPALITQKMPNTLPMIQTINFRGRKFAFGTDYYIPKAVALQFPNIVLNEKCVLFSIVGASVGNVGLYPGGTTAFCGGAIGITRFHNEQDAEWVYNYMISPDGQAQIQYVTKGGAQATVTIADIRNFKIPTPEKNERDAISSILENMDHEIEVLEEKLAKYRQVKQGMMQQLLTGKIRLKNDVVASVHTEQKASAKKTPVRSAHNHQFDDAVSIAAIVDTFYSDKYPLGRVKVQKLLYLLHRHQGVSVSDFKKKAAGPYADTVRYKGGEPIARKNKYIVSESGKQGTRYFRGENMAQALDYVERWGMQADLQWLKDNFLHASRNDLELFATVDMAICDLNEAGVPISVTSIKDLIASNKEWKAKLSKTYFSDWDITRAIKKCTELFN